MLSFFFRDSGARRLGNSARTSRAIEETQACDCGVRSKNCYSSFKNARGGGSTKNNVGYPSRQVPGYQRGKIMMMEIEKLNSGALSVAYGYGHIYTFAPTQNYVLPISP